MCRIKEVDQVKSKYLSAIAFVLATSSYSCATTGSPQSNSEGTVRSAPTPQNQTVIVTNESKDAGGQVSVSGGNSTVEINKSGINVSSDAAKDDGVSGVSNKGGKEIVIDSNKGQRTITCRGDEIVVNGNRNTLTLRGECRSVNVNGNENTIVADAVAEIVTSGNDNKVRWARGADGKQPAISNPGSRNTISQSGQQ